MRSLSPILLCALGCLVALPIAAQRCRTESPERTGTLSDFLSAEGLELLESGWTRTWGRTVGLIRAEREWETPPEDPRARYALVLTSAGAPEAELRALERTLQDQVERRPDEGERVAFFVSEGDSVDVFRVEALAECPPEILNKDELAAALRRRAMNFRDRREFVVKVLARIDATGRILETRVDESSSVIEVDAAAVEIARTARYRPAESEGIPVAVWLSYPITFRRR